MTAYVHCANELAQVVIQLAKQYKAKETEMREMLSKLQG